MKRVIPCKVSASENAKNNDLFDEDTEEGKENSEMLEMNDSSSTSETPSTLYKSTVGRAMENPFTSVVCTPPSVGTSCRDGTDDLASSAPSKSAHVIEGSGLKPGTQLFKKILVQGDEHRRMRADFVQEMRHLSKLRHPCITTGRSMFFLN